MSSSQSALTDDHRWLVSDDAVRWLDVATASPEDPFALTKRLRKDLTAERTHLVIQQAELRRRARDKFEHASQMFFTPKGLEQASDELIATYKARRFAEVLDDADTAQVADLCCGIGGDLLALGQRFDVTGVDSDPLAVLFATINAERVCQRRCRVVQDEVSRYSLDNDAAWHLDPDRRPSKSRTSRVEFSSPRREAIEQLLRHTPTAAIKLAPAADVPDEWKDASHLEWVQTRGECRQQIVWCGQLCSEAGVRTATVIDADTIRTYSGVANEVAPICDTVRRFVYEPEPVVIAARLVGTLAKLLGCEQIANRIAYVTHDQPIDHPLLRPFEVIDQLPFDLKKLKAYFRERRIGHVDVKKRGVDCEPALLQKQLASDGDERVTLIITPHASKTIAIVARRVSSN